MYHVYYVTNKNIYNNLARKKIYKIRFIYKGIQWNNNKMILFYLIIKLIYTLNISIYLIIYIYFFKMICYNCKKKVLIT